MFPNSVSQPELERLMTHWVEQLDAASEVDPFEPLDLYQT